MKKIIFLLCALPVLFYSCSSDDDDNERNQERTVKIVVERTSNNLKAFSGSNIITIDKSNTKFSASDFDSAIDNDGKTLLGVVNTTLKDKQTFSIRQTKVDVQFLDNPSLEDGANGNLETKITIFVDDKSVNSKTFTFNANSANINILDYKE